MKAYHICYHTDEDGLASAAVIYEAIKLKFKNKPMLIFFHKIDYTDLLEDVLSSIHKEDTLYFVDYSFSNEENKKYIKNILYNNTNTVVWIDHHKTSLEFEDELYDDERISKSNNLQTYINIDYCGAILCYKYACKTYFGIDIEYYSIPLYLKYVNSWDLWIFDTLLTKECIYGLSTDERTPKNVFGKIFKFDCNLEAELFNAKKSKKFIKCMQNYIDNCIRMGNIINTYNTNSYKQFCSKYGFEFYIKDALENKEYKCFAANRRCSSELFNSVATKYDIVTTFGFNGECYVYTLYKGGTDIDVDCSRLASILGTINSLGGGGHKGAAGFQTTTQILYKDCTIYINKSFFNKLFDKNKYLIYID